MIIHIEGFNQNNEYFEQDIDITHNTPIYMLTDWADYEWYQDGEELDCMFSEWDKNTTYTLQYNKNKYIRIKYVKKNIDIISPLIPSNIRIKDLKDILSIKDNIYFHKVKLNENKTLDYYNISNMDVLHNKHIYAVGAGAPVDC